MVPELAKLKQVWFWLLLFGLVSVVVGFMALSSAFVATMAKVMVFGVLLLVAGGTEIIHAFMVRDWRGFALHLLSAALYLFAGLFMVRDPIRAATVITLVLSVSFLVGGAMRAVTAIALRFPTWPWVLLNGVVDLVLGALIWSEWPESSLWVLGVFLGIELIFHGWSWIMLALAAKSSN